MGILLSWIVACFLVTPEPAGRAAALADGLCDVHRLLHIEQYPSLATQTCARLLLTNLHLKDDAAADPTAQALQAHGQAMLDLCDGMSFGYEVAQWLEKNPIPTDGVNSPLQRLGSIVDATAPLDRWGHALRDGAWRKVGPSRCGEVLAIARQQSVAAHAHEGDAFRLELTGVAAEIQNREWFLGQLAAFAQADAPSRLVECLKRRNQLCSTQAGQNLDVIFRQRDRENERARRAFESTCQTNALLGRDKHSMGMLRDLRWSSEPARALEGRTVALLETVSDVDHLRFVHGRVEVGSVDGDGFRVKQPGGSVVSVRHRQLEGVAIDDVSPVTEKQHVKRARSAGLIDSDGREFRALFGAYRTDYESLRGRHVSVGRYNMSKLAYEITEGTQTFISEFRRWELKSIQGRGACLNFMIRGVAPRHDRFHGFFHARVQE